MFCVLYEGLAKIALETFDHFATFQMFLTYSFYYLTPFIVFQLKSTTANQININITCEEKNYVLIYTTTTTTVCYYYYHHHHEIL